MCFCICLDIDVSIFYVNVILAFMVCFDTNQVSVNMSVNYMYLVVIKANVLGLSLNLSPSEHKIIKYYVTSLKLHRPMSITTVNLISVTMLEKIVHQCDSMYTECIFKAVFLVTFFSFLILSDLAPHSFSYFDFVRHLSRVPGDIYIYVYIYIFFFC